MISATRLAVSALLATSLVFAQASPRKAASGTVGGKAVSVDYGAPSVKGRKVFGELVPFDQVWRLGANKATHLTAEGDIVIGNLAVPAGTYTLFVVPSAKNWTLIVNKKTGQWGIPYRPEYKESELGRVEMKVEALSAPAEMMTISVDGGVMKVEWENTRATVALKAK